MDLLASSPQSFDLWERHRLQLIQAFDREEPDEVTRWYENLCASTQTSSSTNAQSTRDQVTLSLHWALNLAMFMSRITCAQAVLALMNKLELNTVREMILPCNGSYLIDKYHLLDPLHKTLVSQLHVAACLGSSLFISMLLAKGANPIVLDSSGNTPLISLIRTSSPDHCLQAVKTLLGELSSRLWKKSYADMVNKLGLSALHYAVGRSLDDVVSFLLEDCMVNVDTWKTSHPSQPDQFVGFSPLHMAIIKNNHWAVGRLLAARANVHLFVPCLSSFQMGDTVPHLTTWGACDCGCSFRYPFAIAAPPGHQQGLDLFSALSLAASLDDSDTVEALVDAGADIEEKNSNGCTPLFESAIQACFSSMRVLLSFGANADFVHYDGSTILHAAFSRPAFDSNIGSHRISNTIDCITHQLLVTKNVQINARDHKGWTALMQACRNGFWLTVPFLVLNGAFLSTLDPEGRSALFYAAVHRQDDISYLMLKSLTYYGAACLEPRPYDDNGIMQLWRSPAMPAAYNRDVVALFLLYKGGSLRCRHLISRLMNLCTVPHDDTMWSRLFSGFPVANVTQGFHPTSDELSDSNMFKQNPTSVDASEDKQETIHSSQQAYFPEEEELHDIFSNGQSDWRELLSFCQLPEEQWPISVLDVDSVTASESNAEDGGSDVSETNEARRLQLLQHFLRTVRSTVPTLLDLCSWEIRRMIGDDSLRRRRANDTFGLPAELMHRLMIGYRQRS